MKLPGIFNFVTGLAESVLVTQRFNSRQEETEKTGDDLISGLRNFCAAKIQSVLKQPITEEMKFANERDAVEYGKSARDLARLNVEVGSASLADITIAAAYPQKRGFGERCLSLCFNAEAAHQEADREEFRKTGTTLAARIMKLVK